MSPREPTARQARVTPCETADDGDARRHVAVGGAAVGDASEREPSLPVNPSRTFSGPAPSQALRIPSLHSRGSHRGSFVGGEVPTRVHYESGLEHDVAIVLLARPDVILLREQSPQYVLKGITYTFDALVTLRDGRRYLVAIKPRARVERTGLRRFLRELATHIPVGDADGILILTERHVPTAVVRDAELVHSARREPPGRLDEAVMEIMAATLGAVSIGDLANATGNPGPAFRAVVRRIAGGDLALTSPRPITHASLVARTACAPVA